MNTGVGIAQVGQWYLRRDKGEIFQVTGYDESSGTIEIQTFDGELDEIDAESWRTLPLEFAEQPEDWTGPVDDVEVDDLGYSETDMTGADWARPLQPLRTEQESWEEATPVEEGEAEAEAEIETQELVDDRTARPVPRP
jgi:hypothetical protein